MLPSRKVRTFPTIEASSDAIAEVIAEAADGAAGEFGLVLPGGRTAAAVLHALARKDLPWRRIVLTVGDERMVPPDHPESNAGQLVRLSKELGLDVRITSWVGGTVPNPADGLILARKALEGFPFSSSFTVLGAGPDGHVASLFPGAEIDTSDWIVSTRAPQPPHERLTLSYAALEKLPRLAVLIHGVEKKEALEAALEGAPSPLGRLLRLRPDMTVHFAPASGS